MEVVVGGGAGGVQAQIRQDLPQQFKVPGLGLSASLVSQREGHSCSASLFSLAERRPGSEGHQETPRRLTKPQPSHYNSLIDDFNDINDTTHTALRHHKGETTPMGGTGHPGDREAPHSESQRLNLAS